MHSHSLQVMPNFRTKSRTPAISHATSLKAWRAKRGTNYALPTHFCPGIRATGKGSQNHQACGQANWPKTIIKVEQLKNMHGRAATTAQKQSTMGAAFGRTLRIRNILLSGHLNVFMQTAATTAGRWLPARKSIEEQTTHSANCQKLLTVFHTAKEQLLNRHLD